MAENTENKPRTHKHRNIIDDILDLGLTVAMIVWYFFGFEVDHETLAIIGGLGASARATLRRILMNMWGSKLGLEPEPEGEPAPEGDDAEGDDGEDESESDSDEGDSEGE